jgi:hypothetical protein
MAAMNDEWMSLVMDTLDPKACRDNRGPAEHGSGGSWTVCPMPFSNDFIGSERACDGCIHSELAWSCGRNVRGFMKPFCMKLRRVSSSCCLGQNKGISALG